MEALTPNSENREPSQPANVTPFVRRPINLAEAREQRPPKRVVKVQRPGNDQPPKPAA